MKWQKVLFIIVGSVAAAIAGGLFTGLILSPTIPRNGGLAAAGTAAIYFLLGLGVSLIAALIGLSKLSLPRLRWVSIVLLLLAGVAWLLARSQGEQLRAERKARSTYVAPDGFSVDPTDVESETIPIASAGIVQEESTPSQSPPLASSDANADELIGMGLARVHFSRQGLRLYFWSDPTVAGPPPDDSLIYDFDNGLVLRYAPPYLTPFYLKEDYESLLFRFVGISSNGIEILLNERENRRAWVARDQVEVLFWPAFLATVFAVHTLDNLKNPVRRRPTDAAPTADFPAGTLWLPQAVSGDWIQVFPMLDGERTVELPVWLRWRRGDQLLVGWDYQM